MHETPRMNTPDHTFTIPWHIAQVYSLTDTQRLELLLSFYACWQATEETLQKLTLTPTTIRTTADAQRIACAKLSLKTLETILKDASLPIPDINHN